MGPNVEEKGNTNERCRNKSVKMDVWCDCVMGNKLIKGSFWVTDISGKM